MPFSGDSNEVKDYTLIGRWFSKQKNGRFILDETTNYNEYSMQSLLGHADITPYLNNNREETGEYTISTNDQQQFQADADVLNESDVAKRKRKKEKKKKKKKKVTELTKAQIYQQTRVDHGGQREGTRSSSSSSSSVMPLQ